MSLVGSTNGKTMESDLALYLPENSCTERRRYPSTKSNCDDFDISMSRKLTVMTNNNNIYITDPVIMNMSLR